jgi:Zn-dependent protease
MIIILTIFSLIVLFFSIMVHEIAHGSVALFLGDTTAKRAGRLTLNPLKHIDVFGSIILPLLLIISRSPVLIGWAKPVPINPYNFRDQKWGTLKVAIAGPLMNFAIAIFFGVLLRFLNLPQVFSELLAVIMFYNFLWGLFNLIPIPPLDGSHIIFSFFPPTPQWMGLRAFLNQYGLVLLIFFIFLGMGILADGALYLSYSTGGEKIIPLLNAFFGA